MRIRTGAAAVAAAGIAVIFAVAASDSGGAATPGSRTVSFGVRFSPFNLLDLGAPGLSEGDQVLFKDVLVGAAGTPVGHDGGFCVVTKVEAAVVEDECLASYVLPGGQITTQGLDTPAAEKPFAITGGTGRYRQARGDGLLVEFGDGTGKVTFHLAPADS